MAFSGFYEQAHLGAIYPPYMVLGKRSPDAFIGGVKVDCGLDCCKRCSNTLIKRDESTGISTFVDGSVIRAHQHAAGAKHSDGASEALGYSKGGFSTKIHLRCDGNGLPMTMQLTVGERHEAVMFEPLMEQGAVKRPTSGRPRIRPQRVAGDKGYSSRKIRGYLRRRGIRYTIPRKSNEHRGGTFDNAKSHELRHLIHP